MQDKDKLIEELKAEIETLKKVKDFACINLNNYIADNNKLKAENEKLKEEILKWQTAYSRQYQINENKGYNKKEEQYRQTLQEIKKIAEQYYPIPITMDFTAILDNQKSNATLLYEILQLITKAESEG